ncbi:MAG: IclR family transcriptional regulator [Sporolactobacillus sp.]|jgi:DNA-binding IclR family transcriptional regulator|nr:IclR family transcriptional regulator [Sporolactobacillus sp.]
MDRFVKVMDLLSDSREKGIGITDLSRQTLMSKGTLHRMLQSMAGHQLVVQDRESKKYKLGPRSMKWGSRFLQSQDPVGLLSRHCDLLGDRSGLYAFVCRLQADEIFCIHTHQPSGVKNSFFVHVGQRMPIHCAAAAEIILAFQTEETIDRLLKKEDLRPYTPYTVTDPDRIRDILARARRRRLAFCNQELERGVTAISVPVFHRPERTLVSLSVVGDYRDIEARKKTIVDELLRIADRASDQLTSMSSLSSLI